MQTTTRLLEEPKTFNKIRNRKSVLVSYTASNPHAEEWGNIHNSYYKQYDVELSRLNTMYTKITQKHLLSENV